MLHEHSAIEWGRSGPNKYGRIIFCEPGPTSSLQLDDVIGRTGDRSSETYVAFYINRSAFVLGLVEATRAWWESNKNVDPVASNAAKLIGRKSAAEFPEIAKPEGQYFIG